MGLVLGWQAGGSRQKGEEEERGGGGTGGRGRGVGEERRVEVVLRDGWRTIHSRHTSVHKATSFQNEFGASMYLTTTFWSRYLQIQFSLSPSSRRFTFVISV
jgi:hypothetical protein